MATKKTAPKPKKAPAQKSAVGDDLWAHYCAKPDDHELLRVFADALAEAGNPRGAFINLCLLDEPTAEQQKVQAAMMKKDKKVLAGPGGAFLREFEFGANGLVSQARTEAAQVIAGLEALKTLNPRLVLTITSIKTLKDAQDFGKLDLTGLYFVDFGWITGTHGGVRLNDKLLMAAAPAFANVKHLQLSCRGNPAACFSPAGLRAIAPHLQNLRYLSIDFYSEGLPPPEDYLRAVRETVPHLRAFDFSHQPGTGVLEGGRPSPSSDRAIAEGRTFSDLLEAALS